MGAHARSAAVQRARSELVGAGCAVDVVGLLPARAPAHGDGAGGHRPAATLTWPRYGDRCPGGGPPVPTDAERDESSRISSRSQVGIDNLKVGDCVLRKQYVEDLEDGEAPLGEVTAVPCDEPHKSEVFDVYTLSPDGFKNQGALDRKASMGCLPAFKEYVGAPTADHASRSSTTPPNSPRGCSPATRSPAWPAPARFWPTRGWPTRCWPTRCWPTRGTGVAAERRWLKLHAPAWSFSRAARCRSGPPGPVCS